MKTLVNRTINYFTRNEWWKSELRLFFSILVSYIALEAFSPLSAIYSGNYTKEAFTALGMALLTSFIRALITIAFPALFPMQNKENK